MLVAGNAQVVVFELGRRMGFAGIEIRHCRGLRMGMLVSAEAADIRRVAGMKDLGSWMVDQAGEQRIECLEDR